MFKALVPTELELSHRVQLLLTLSPLINNDYAREVFSRNRRSKAKFTWPRVTRWAIQLHLSRTTEVGSTPDPRKPRLIIGSGADRCHGSI